MRSYSQPIIIYTFNKSQCISNIDMMSSIKLTILFTSASAKCKGLVLLALFPTPSDHWLMMWFCSLKSWRKHTTNTPSKNNFIAIMSAWQVKWNKCVCNETCFYRYIQMIRRYNSNTFQNIWESLSAVFQQNNNSNTQTLPHHPPQPHHHMNLLHQFEQIPSVPIWQRKSYHISNQ